MKAGWEIKRLGDVLEVQNGYAFDSKAFEVSKGMPLIRIRDLKGATETETRFVGDYDNKYVVKAGDLLIGMDGEFGCYEWKGNLALLNQRVCRLQGFSSDLLPRFLFYGMNSHLKAIEDVTGFTTVKHLSSRQILEIEFILPSFPEQQRIVAILDEAFDGIAVAKANAEQNRQNARELFDSYLQSVFTQRGEGWVEKPLGSIASVLSGFSFKSSDFSRNNAINSIKITNVGVKEFVRETDSFLPEHLLQKYSSYSVSAGSIVIALTRTIISSGLKVAIVPEEFDGALLNQRVAAITVAENGVLQKYLYAYLGTQHVIDYVMRQVNTLMQPNLSINDLRDLPVPVPSLIEQHSIVARLDSLSAETQRLEAIYQQKIAALDELKQSLLHRAFAGEL